MWYNYLDNKYAWVKGHADKLDREPEKYGRLNILADETCDEIRAAATGSTGTKGSCGMWPSETCALFIRGVKITIHMKERLTQQLLVGDMQKYLMYKDNCTRQVFDSINRMS
jgi:hypothetical protein